VLLNLLANALRHTPADGTVAVRVHTHDDAVQVTVEDTGDAKTMFKFNRRLTDPQWKFHPAPKVGGSGH